MLKTAALCVFVSVSVGCGGDATRQTGKMSAQGGTGLGAGMGGSSTEESTLEDNGGSGIIPGDEDTVSGQPTLGKYLEAFLKDAEEYDNPIPAERVSQLTSLSYASEMGAADQIGVCGIHPDTRLRFVKILSPASWPVSVPTGLQFRATVYHELAHCLLEVDHYTGTKVSLMSTYLYSHEQLAAVGWSELLQDLFDEVGLPKIPLSLSLVGGEDWVVIPYRR